MEVKLSHVIMIKDKINTFRTAHKSFESNVIPHKGDFIADSAFKDPNEHEVTGVVIDYADDVCYVTLKPIELETDEEKAIERLLEIYKLHEWEYLSL